ncbi:MAG: hypothetical protein WC686_03610 [Candidatus Shapirobacteria bacterium]|jgi:predicted phosphoribosyltransferase
MVFKNQAESASLLSARIQAEIPSEYLLCYINPEAQGYADLIAKQLETQAFDLSKSIGHLPQANAILIIDTGDTRAAEYSEYSDLIRRTFPETKIIIAVPVVPQSEEATFKTNCDSLLTLHVEPLFFSMSQFYPQTQS